MTKLNQETIKFFRGSWSGYGKKTIRNLGGNFWGPSRTRGTIIPQGDLNKMLEEGVAVKVPGGIRFPTTKNP